jgi:4-hydroxy-3-methylbut-2-enyl diphosphate reductase
MKIKLATSAGFCFGVKRAIQIAFQAARLGGKLEMLSDIVHNEDVVRDIAKAGIKRTNQLKKGKAKALLISAHGLPDKTILKARRLGYKIIDATCPMVKKIHRLASSMERQKRRIIIIGDKRHSEVKGVIGQLRGRARVFSSPAEVTGSATKGIKRAGVVVQSTQNIERVREILAKLSRYIDDLKFCNTICKPTSLKQGEIRKMPLENDVMLIIGSKTSANTKRLYKISRSLNKNSHWVQSDKDIRKAWLRKAKTMGITAGASTPDYTTNKVIRRIKQLVNPSRP